jgi:hypothetical protein
MGAEVSVWLDKRLCHESKYKLKKSLMELMELRSTGTFAEEIFKTELRNLI